ncbi:MAG: hypothetical protein IJO59_01115 [Clostridia bacterium]|nr:hypothetical protein [Clostridia bacterium]
MKKYYCPYCGEPTFSSYQKYTSKYSRFGVREALFYTCPKCHNEIERKYAYRDTKIKYLSLSCLLFILLTFVFVLIKTYILMAVALICLAVSSTIEDYYVGKACVLARVDGNYNDKLYPVKINSKEVLSGGIYLLKPTSGELNKVSVHREYIAEITKDNSNQYFVRVIKPIDAAFTPQDFSVFDDKKCIGTGSIFV